MSELVEIRQSLKQLLDASARTETNVKWICDGMAAGTARMNTQDTRIGKLENRQHWYAGFAACFGAAVTALLEHMRTTWGGGVL